MLKHDRHANDQQQQQSAPQDGHHDERVDGVLNCLRVGAVRAESIDVTDCRESVTPC